jgi:hypothetical protein
MKSLYEPKYGFSKYHKEHDLLLIHLQINFGVVYLWFKRKLIFKIKLWNK